MKCPKCNSEIKNKNINIQSDIAQCNICNDLFKISENINVTEENFNINETPNGTWFKSYSCKTTIGASTRSPIAFFLVPFMIIWSGGSLSGLYGTQIINNEFNLFQTLFGIPFLIGSIIFWSLTLMTIWGKVELSLDKQGGVIFTGVGNLGLKKRFKWSEISKIKEKQINFRYPGGQGNSIVLEGKRSISFGSGLKEERLYYLIQAIKTTIYKNKWI